jgi:hypothetical protein
MLKKISSITGLANGELLTGLFIFFLMGAYYSLILIGRVSTDIQVHASVAHSFVVNNDKLTPNFLYFFLVAALTGFSSTYKFYYVSSVFLLSTAITAKFFLNLEYLKKYAAVNFRLNIFLAISMLFVFALPSLDFIRIKSFYLGQLAPVVWHNSTVIFLMPFSLLLFFKVYELLYSNSDSVKKKDILILFSLLLINALIKPSFLFTILPVFCFLALSKTIKKGIKKNIVYGFFCFVAAALFILLEYYLIYKANNISTINNINGEKSSVIIEPFVVWKNFSTNLFFSLITSCFFPIIYLICYFRQALRNSMVIFSLCNFIAGVAEWSLLAEEGPRKFHGNFYWQVVVVMYLLFFTLVLDFLKNNKTINKKNVKQVIVISAFSFHVLWGIFYWVKIILFRGYY